MSRSWQGIVGVILARPLLAIAIAVVVVTVGYLGFTERQTTPVTHRTERVSLTDRQQMQLGAEDYIPKPFNPVLLRARIDASLTRKRLRDQEVAYMRRLEDEYELKERADLLTRKLTVISDTAKALADIIDTERSLRLERIIIALILLETIFAGYQLFLH